MAAIDYRTAIERCSDQDQINSYTRMLEHVLRAAADQQNVMSASEKNETAQVLTAGPYVMYLIVSLHMINDLMLFLLPSDLARLE